METRCSVCGCITDTAELSPVTLSEKKFEVCPFCNKKLKAINEYPKENSALAREILTADTKGRRSHECSAMLYRHFYSLGISPTTENAVSSSKSKEKAVQNKAAPAPLTKDLAQEVAELKNRVETLSGELKKFKRRYYFSRILGIIAPVLITFIMLIILLSSGALDAIFDYYGFLSEYAGM